MVQKRNNKILGITLSKESVEGIEILKEIYSLDKTSKIIDLALKEVLESKGYELKEENMSVCIENKLDVCLVIDGKETPLYSKNGEYFAEGIEGKEYAIKITNNSLNRNEVVISVDGLSVIDGELASYESKGYILNPYQSAIIKGWRRTETEVAAFKFGKVEDSYAEKISAGGNTGIIGIAVFPERNLYNYWNLKFNENKAPFPPKTHFTYTSNSLYSATANISRSLNSSSENTSGSLGTEYGKRTEMFTSSVFFKRNSDVPIQTLNIKYNSREQLIKLGVITETPKVSEPNPFPGNKVACKPPVGWKG